MPHLTLGQVYAALSYYYDHKPVIDADIESGERLAETLRSGIEDPEARSALLVRIATRRRDAHEPA
jgi:hypothetical protein